MENLNLNQLKIISHSLGIDLFKSVMSDKLKDKRLPRNDNFYRNYYNTSERQAEVYGITNLVNLDIMVQFQKEYYRVTQAGIDQFKKQYYELVQYNPSMVGSLMTLKHKMNFYCEFYHYKFGDDNAQHIIDNYTKYWLKKYNVSHTTEDVIKYFQKDLKHLLKAGAIKPVIEHSSTRLNYDPFEHWYL